VEEKYGKRWFRVSRLLAMAMDTDKNADLGVLSGVVDDCFATGVRDLLPDYFGQES
jgi:hypothetical protein